VVTGISEILEAIEPGEFRLQWGPVVVTGIRRIVRVWTYSRLRELQWGPVVVTGIRRAGRHPYRCTAGYRFNGVRSW